MQTPRGAVYSVSQRADHIWEGVSSATTRSRPIINTRDEPHADAERYRRLHVIVGDSNMSETTTILKLGSADLVLRMLEAGRTMRDLSLENPIRAIREMSHDQTGRRTVRLANGKQMSSLDLQNEYFEGLQFCRLHGASLMTQTRFRPERLNCGSALLVGVGGRPQRDRDGDRLGDGCVSSSDIWRNDMELSNPRIAQLDLAYHDITRVVVCSTSCNATGSRSSRQHRYRRLRR